MLAVDVGDELAQRHLGRQRREDDRAGDLARENAFHGGIVPPGATVRIPAEYLVPPFRDAEPVPETEPPNLVFGAEWPVTMVGLDVTQVTRLRTRELAEIEAQHENLAAKLGEKILTPDTRAEEAETERRMFLLQYVQPGLAGLMDGSVSTLAPLFAAAFATHNTWDTFLVGLAASVGAGISMGFAEALSDDGSLTGRGTPWLRGSVCGLMTTVGGIGHTLPYLVPEFWIATAIAIAVVIVELGVISWIRYRYMDTSFLAAAFQVMVGGALVFIAGILIGSS